MHLSRLRPSTDSAVVARALSENAALRARSYALVEGTNGETPWAIVLAADPRDRNLRLLAQSGVGAEVTVSVPDGATSLDYVGKLTHVHEISAIRGALANGVAPMAWSGLALAGFVNAIPAVGGDLSVVALSLAATFEGVRRLAGYFKRLTGSDLAGSVLAAATESATKGAQVRAVRVAEPAPVAPMALPAPASSAMVIPPLTAATFDLLQARR